MQLTNLFTAYLNAYAAKDIAQVSAMFADNIVLRDWKISVAGKAAAVAETQKNFHAANKIAINILRTHVTASSVVGELHIVVDDSEELFVVDIVEFNHEGKITAIRAYLGRGD